MAEIMNMEKINLANDSSQNITLARLTSIRKNTHIGTQTGCFNNSVKNKNGFLINYT